MAFSELFCLFQALLSPPRLRAPRGSAAAASAEKLELVLSAGFTGDHDSVKNRALKFPCERCYLRELFSRRQWSAVQSRTEGLVLVQTNAFPIHPTSIR